MHLESTLCYIVFFLIQLTSAAYTSPIKHIVLLMEENRSFDHMLGFMKGLDGLKGDESNPLSTLDPKSERISVQKTSPYIGPFDPNHSTPPTTQKIFGLAGLSTQTKPKMDGFIEFAFHNASHKDPSSVMNMFTPDRLPVMTKLVEEFAVFNRFFASHPGPTWPNRLFCLMATSEGCTETGVTHPKTVLYTGKTIFDSIEEGGLDWKFYFADAPLELVMLEKLTLNPLKVKGWEHLFEDIAAGTLPAFSWVNPRWFVNTTTSEGANDQHPDHDVRLGEGLFKTMYEALRAGPKWNETLFIITYDEHGGFYDHVPTPLNVPAPDDSKSFPDSFDFKRLGIRMPTLLISPWIEKGTVIGRPDGPYPTSEYELTSIVGTVKKLFNLPSFLTKRDAWAGTFEKYLNRSEPRTDCPETLPNAPLSLGVEHAAAEAALPLNDLQQNIVDSFARLTGTPPEKRPRLQGDGSEWIREQTELIMNGYYSLDH